MPISEQVLRDLRDIVRATRTGSGIAGGIDSLENSELHLVFRVLPSLLDEVESLRDSTLAKDFLALYQAARLVTSAPHATGGDVEGLALHVVRLAPLYDDVRRNLNAQLAARAWPVDPAHSVRVLQSDGTGRVECDHTFKGTTRCVHCGKAFDELRAESQAELARLQPQLPDGVLHATPDELADIVQRQLDEHEARGIIPSGHVVIRGFDLGAAEALHGLSELAGALEPDDELAVPITLGPSLLPRVEALVATGRLGSELEHVVQTLFVLGMLDAEGQDPQAHVGAPHSHVSAEALFVRFGLPHEGGERATRQRASILRQLLLDLSEWCDEGDPLRPAFAAAIEALPR
jgi:hypothetical protein